MKNLRLTTVTPVYSGEETISKLVHEIEEFQNYLIEINCPITFNEAIFVDDESIDNSDELLEKLCTKHEWIRVINLSKNFGQHPATMAGILHSSGDWVVTLDEDLQHRPKYILELLKKAVIDGKDIVYAAPTKNVHDSYYRDSGSKIAKWLVSKMSGNNHIKKFNSFRLIRGSIARATAAVAINQTYFDVALTWFTNRIDVGKIPLEDSRYKKKRSSGYSLKRLISHTKRLILSSDFKILRIGSLLGFFAVIIAGIVALYTIYSRIFFPYVEEASGWASIMIAILFLGGMNALLLGLIIEHLSIILMQNHGKPTFFEVDRSLDKDLKDWFLLNEEEN